MRMAEPRSPNSTDLYTLFGFSSNTKASSILDISKAYKFITTKWHHDHDHRHRRKGSKSDRSKSDSVDDDKESTNGKKNDERVSSSGDATTPWEEDDDPSSHHHRRHHRGGSSIDDNFVLRRGPSFISRSASRRSKTPTPTSFSRMSSRRSSSVADFLGGGLGRSLSRSASRKKGHGISDDPPEGAAAATTPTAGSSRRRTPARSMSKVGRVAPDSPEGPTTPAAAASRSAFNRTPTRSMSRTASSVRRGSGGPTPIVFSQTAARKKPQPVEKKLECTLEELLEGCIKKVLIVRNVLSESGMIQEEEMLKINVEPGWRKGTKVMFEGKGDEKPGYLPADIVFVIEEKRHPLFKRRGDDLEIDVVIPLVQALMGCTLAVPLLGGDKMTLCLNEIMYPGYEKAIPGQGMPYPKETGRRGELRITFFVEFPLQLSEEQRHQARSILDECDSS